MFDNIGGKIKTLATVVCFLGIGASIIAAIALWAQNDRYTPTIALGFGVLIGGSLASWIGSFFTYGFGQLIEDATAIREVLSNGVKQNDGAAHSISTPIINKDSGNTRSSTWSCSKCGCINYYSRIKCSLCGESK